MNVVREGEDKTEARGCRDNKRVLMPHPGVCQVVEQVQQLRLIGSQEKKRWPVGGTAM